MDARSRALRSLHGLSVGDAFGELFFGPRSDVEERIEFRHLPGRFWGYTDDTEMALGLFEVLDAHGCVRRDVLARTFARRYMENPLRGYGGGAHRILQEVWHGTPWQQAARAAFNGQGSRGNGAAMRVGPLGAWFADDLVRCAEEAAKSAMVTHAHPDAQAGAVAVAVAAALAAGTDVTGTELLAAVAERTPEGIVRDFMFRVAATPLTRDVRDVAEVFGCGEEVLAEDTVPFSLWCAARHLDNYEEAMWSTVSALGDRDTTCAIVGGIVGLRAEIPDAWIAAREPVLV